MNSWFEDNGNNDPLLKRDDCLVRFKNELNEDVHVYSVYNECYKCPYREESFSPLSTIIERVINTKYDVSYKILTSNNTSTSDSSNVICEIDTNFREFGIYNFIIRNDGCEIDVEKDGVNIYFPLITVFFIYGLITALILILNQAKRIKNNGKEKALDLDLGKVENKKERLKSLDTFRGISIVIMIFVNYGGGGYNFMEHAIWNGLTVGDLVFPWFMWIMGVCIPISVASTFKKDISRRKAFLNILKRSCLLFCIGLFLGASPYLDKLRIFGVLQRFAICYLIVTSMHLYLTNKKPPPTVTVFQNVTQDFTALRFQWPIVLFIVMVHCLIIFLFPIPDCPNGYLGPGGLHDNAQFYNCTGGATGYIDTAILGNHVYHYPTIKEIYGSSSFDPEGILGCLTSILQVFLGVHAGIILKVYKEDLSRLIRWIIWGLLCGLLGGILCGFSKDDGPIPVNKNLWSLSFVLVTSSFAFILLSMCYYLIDIKRYWTGKPFLFAGMNSLIMYIGHSMTSDNFPVHWYSSRENKLSTHFIMTVENLWATCIWILVSYYLYKINYFFNL